MRTLFFNIVLYIGTFVILISFIKAFRLRNKKDLPAYFRFFYCVTFIELMFSFNTILYAYTKAINTATFSYIQNLLSLIEFLVIGIFFIIFLKKFQNNIFFKLIFLAFTGLIGFVIYKDDFFHNWLYQINALQSLAISIFCIYYYYKIFIINSPFNLSHNPTFWIVTGFFVSYGVNFPQYAIRGYILTNLSFTAANILFTFINILIIVKHLFFIKAYRVAKFADAEN